MHNLSQVEESYRKYSSNLPSSLPEGLTMVNLSFLQQLNLLHYHDSLYEEQKVSQCFHVVESYEKITLINDEFVIWIIPEKIDGVSLTICLIAVIDPDSIKLEAGFQTAGVYNTSKLVLRILEKILIDIRENEDCIKKLKSG